MSPIPLNVNTVTGQYNKRRLSAKKLDEYEYIEKCISTKSV